MSGQKQRSALVDGRKKREIFDFQNLMQARSGKIAEDGNFQIDRRQAVQGGARQPFGLPVAHLGKGKMKVPLRHSLPHPKKRKKPPQRAGRHAHDRQRDQTPHTAKGETPQRFQQPLTIHGSSDPKRLRSISREFTEQPPIGRD